MMMAPPQVVGVLLKKPGEQSHSRISPLDPQETKIRGELYVEDLNERRIVSVRMGWLWVEGTQMRLPLRALNLRQAAPGICQPHVLALGFTLSNSQGDPLATFWADTEPIYWSWVRAIAAELVRQTPFRAQRCLNFLEILTICPRGPLPLPDSPTETRRRSRSELRCWLGDSPMSAKSARGSSILEDSRRRARSELRGWSSSNSSDEDLHLSEFRSMQTSLLPKVETALVARTWGCSESSEGSDDSLPWGAGCRSSVDSIDSAPSVPEPDTRELRIQRYKEARRRENEARSRKVLEEDAKRRKARQEENNNNNNNNNSNSNNNNNNVNEPASARTSDATQRYDDASRITENNAASIKPMSDEVNGRLSDTGASNRTAEREKVTKNNRHNTKTATANTQDFRCRSTDALSRNESLDKNAKDHRNNTEITKTTTATNTLDKTSGNREKITRRLSESVREPAKHENRDKDSRDHRNTADTAKTATTTNPLDKTIENGEKVVRRLSETTGDSTINESRDNNSRDHFLSETTKTATTTNSFEKKFENCEKNRQRLSETINNSLKAAAAELSPPRDRRNNAEATKTTKTTRTIVASLSDNLSTSEPLKISRSTRSNNPTTKTSVTTVDSSSSAVETATTTTNPFVRAAETVDAITRRLPPLRVSSESPVVRFRDCDAHRHEDTRNNNGKQTNLSSSNNREASARSKIDSPPSPGVVRTDSGERRSRARERRNVREKSQIIIVQQPQQSRIPESSLKTIFLQERRERLSLMTKIPSQDFSRTNSNSRTDEKSCNSRERGAISLPRTTTFALVDENARSSCEEDVARLLERCQRVDRYVPVREKLTLFESLSRMGGRLARSTEDLGRSSSRPSPKGKQRARSLHDLNRAARSVPVREMCRLFEGERDIEQSNSSSNGGSSLIVLSNGQSRFAENYTGRASWRDSPSSILRNNAGNQDAPPCVRTSTRRKHYQK